MNRILNFVLGLSCVAVLSVAPAAHADIPPPDACQSENAACTNAGPSYDQDGVCKSTMCTKGPPGQQITYECFRCELATTPGAAGAAGIAGAAGTAGTPSAAGAAPVSEGNGKKENGGCAVRAIGSEKRNATWLLGLGLLGFAISRRRR